MNILYHHRTQLEDAQGIHIAEIVRAFRHLGHHVDVTALVKDNDYQSSKSNWSKLVHVVPDVFYELMEWGYNLIAYRNITQAIQEQTPDFIYERYSLYTVAGVLAAQCYKIPLILEVNSPLAFERAQYGGLAFKPIARYSERWICTHATKVITVSTPLKEILIKSGVPENKICVMSNGINLSVFHPNVDGSEVRKRYEFKNQIVIGFIGWFRAWHAIELLLKAVAELSSQKYNLHLLLVGDGPVRSSIEQTCQQLSLENHVTITGGVPHEEIPSYISAMDIAVQPHCTWYSSPMKIFEYMAMAKPIIAPKLPNIMEILTHGRNVLLFSPMNQDELKKAIAKLAESSDLRKQLGNQAYQDLINKGYTWENNAQRVIELVSRYV